MKVDLRKKEKENQRKTSNTKHQKSTCGLKEIENTKKKKEED